MSAPVTNALAIPVAITGVGPVSALGTGVDAFFDALVAGQSGTRTLTRCAPPARGCTVAAEVDEPAPLPLDPANPMPRAVQLAIHAARLAMADARYEGDRERVGVVVGTGVGNVDLIEQAAAQLAGGKRVSPATAFRAFTHAAACEIVRDLDLRGPMATVTSGCNSGADAIGLALDWLRLGRADAVLVGGTEAELSPTFLGMMTAARALAVRYNGAPADASRPFDTGRDGNVPGEGAGFLLLERVDAAERRKARVRAGLRGYASRAVGRRPQYDPFNPVFDPAPMLRTLRAALADAGTSPAQLSAVSANGSASVFYDVVESTAVAELLGERAARVPVHSIKGALGQTGAVTPALQAIAAALCVERGVLPPTRNVAELDPRVTLDVVRGEARRQPVDSILCNAIGFGGFYYSALVVGRL
jgi:3-oxoacyl-(acyl-carrier-protein) synthase